LHYLSFLQKPGSNPENGELFSDMNKSDIKKQHIIKLGFSVVILVLVSFISTRMFFRIDLTSEKRFTLSNETKKILKNIDDVVYVKVYLDGDLPAGFKKLREGIRETLDEFRVYAKNNIQYEFINPAESSDPKVRNKVFSELYKKGLKPTNLESRDDEGGSSEKVIFPGALITFHGNEVPVSLLKNNVGLPAEENLNNSIRNIEYELIKTIYNITNKKVEKIAFIEGHGELDEFEVRDITIELSNYFQVDRGIINGKNGILDDYKAIIIAKPSKSFSEADKLVIDQYIMNGGKVLWFIDGVNVSMDSLANGATFAFINDLNINDQLFNYGVRINSNLVQDIQCNVLPVQAGTNGSQAKWVPAPWLYYPIISPLVQHPVTRDLNLIFSRFPSQVDTVGGSEKVRKTFLLRTSTFSKTVNAPLYIRLEEVKRNPVRAEFNKPNIPIAVLLEGQFKSVFRNRDVNKIIAGFGAYYKPESFPTKMIVVADGNMIANEVKMTPQGPMFTQLGYDKYTRQMFGNKDFIVNAVNYITDETGLISLRSKDFKLRLLDKNRIRSEKLKWQLINTLLPLLIVVGFGLYYQYYRRKKYGVGTMA
jgi:ABC-2 type transport system permease protein